ncbi:MAG TPA: hypothetical protein VGE52_10515 [Pirellulales bacterium]
MHPPALAILPRWQAVRPNVARKSRSHNKSIRDIAAMEGRQAERRLQVAERK